MKYAVADISSSSLSVIIAEDSDGGIEVTGKEREPLSLLYYMDGDKLSRRGTEKLVSALSQMKSRLKEAGVSRCWLIATAALRHISNFGEVTEAVRAATELEMNLIDGRAEAYCDYVANMRYSSEGGAALVDLGGKSIEICALGRGKEGMTCFDFGLLDLYEKFADGRIQPDEDEAKKMGKYASSRFDKAGLPREGEYTDLVLVGQTCGAIYDMYAEFTDTPCDGGEKTMERKKFGKLFRRLTQGADRSRLILKTAPEKTHVILPAAAVIKKLIKRFDVVKVTVSDRGVKEGYLSLVLSGDESGSYYDFDGKKSEGAPRAVADEPPVKQAKKRGRPVKANASAAGAAKKRGRPKKANGDTGAAKKRGRRKKTNGGTGAAKKRGRPKKAGT